MNMEKETEVKEVKLADAESAPAQTPAAAGADAENPAAAALRAQLSELNDKYMRLAAELENTRRRAQLDTDIAARNRAMSVAGNFLPVMDAIIAAAAHNPDDAGVRAMAMAMESALAKTGIMKIETVGQQMNPQFHNAVQVVETPQPDQPCATKPAPNTIVEELQSGYMFGDSVLRPAMVVVGK
jgi:molecular chaperone GrpE